MARKFPASSGAHCGVLPPPPGVIADCSNPTTKTASNVALHTVIIFLATVSLVIRLYTRRFIIRSIELDDYLCVLGFALLVAYSAVLLACGKIFFGHHIWDIPKADYIHGHTLQVATEWIYCFVCLTLKLAVLWLYRRIFGPVTRVHYVINSGTVFIIVAYTALFFTSLLTCMPLKRRFNPFAQGYCLPSGVTAYLSGAINVLTDAFVVFPPLPIIGKLNMAPSQKLRALAVFGLGIIVFALSITRLAKTPLVFSFTDPTWELSNFAIYSILELYFGLMCICSLAPPSFLDKVGPRFVTRMRSYSSNLRLVNLSRARHTTQDNTSSNEQATGPNSLSFQSQYKSEREASKSLDQHDSTPYLPLFNTIH